MHFTSPLLCETTTLLPTNRARAYQPHRSVAVDVAGPARQESVHLVAPAARNLRKIEEARWLRPTRQTEPDIALHMGA